MKILLVNPRYPDTFFGFRHVLRFISKKAALPPLGLLTVAAMVPEGYQKRVIDMNVEALDDADIQWADYVFLSAMSIQKEYAMDVVKRCNRLHVKVVAGGPLFTTEYQQLGGIDHFVLREAEATLPALWKDLESGQAKPVYSGNDWPDICRTPAPAWGLINIKRYAWMSVQYSRGCPYDCEFCDVVLLNGRKPRTKDKDQLLAELETLYRQGWRGRVFVVDDNFIAHKQKLKSEVLPALIAWMEGKRHPFAFFTQASLNLASDEELMYLMVEAGFDTVFVGVETPNDDSLSECGKHHNRNRDLIASIKKIQNHGLQVQGGFIVGFDSDPPSIFDNQINLIQKSGIVSAVVSLLNAPRGTKLYERLKKENRLLETTTWGDSVLTNIVPKMNHETLLDGYRRVVSNIYSPKQHYERIRVFMREYRHKRKRASRPQPYAVIGLFKVIWALGIRCKGRIHFWRLLFSTLFTHPRLFGTSMGLAVAGLHFRKIAEVYDKNWLVNHPG